jgi:hypothetical protein
MADNPETSEPFSLKRWSQRKRAAGRTDAARPSPPTQAPVAEDPVGATIAGTEDSAPAPMPEAAPLPPVDSLTFDSDFSAFMQREIDPGTQRAALRKLFSDPSFNVMDGLDIYVGDYTQPDPMPEGMLEKLSAVYAMLDPVAPAQNEPAPADILPPPAAARTIAATDVSTAVAVGDAPVLQPPAPAADPAVKSDTP